MNKLRVRRSLSVVGLLVGLVLSLQLNLAAVSVNNFKHDSQAFCDVLYHNNSLDSSLNKQFVFDCAKLMSVIKDMIIPLDNIAVIQETETALNLDRNLVLNKHILELNTIRKMLLRIKNKHKLSSQLSKIFDGYRNILDAHYYELNPSYEGYLLKQCNVSLKNTMYTSMYATGSFVVGYMSALGYLNSYESSCQNARNVDHNCPPHCSSVFVNGCFVAGVGLTSTAAYLAYCAYKKINDPEYEYELIVQE